MNLEEQRQSAQLKFIQTNENISFGQLDNFPFTVEQLKATTADSPYVIETFQSGLTAVVYHIRVQDTDWTLKCKRPESLVKNIDGQTSFLNEVQRRVELMTLKAANPDKFSSIIDTQFASFQHGVILSPWIDGDAIKTLERSTFEQIFSAIVNLELSGLFEWDYSSGNILVTPDGGIKLFDFGYMYQFDAKTEFNSNGTAAPLFHGIERFETRFFFDYLLKTKQSMSQEQQFELYRLEKECALAAYQVKLDKLVALGADLVVIERQQSINQLWKDALASESKLRELFLIEKFRSNLLDLLDDMHGKSCTLYTIKKAELILSILKTNFGLLKLKGCLFFGDEELSPNKLLVKYEKMKLEAIGYQLA